ncbi:hypothetical protein LCGC14_1559990 [marine sediment metagenome]|uniref:Uncharacterized protein n=1 Tax=marine sediment metagenome TaxID=412755 RepID=A0A0F9J8T3_9ZZZZ
MSSFDIDLIAIIYIMDIGMQNNPQFRVNAVKDIIHREVGNLMLIHARGSRTEQEGGKEKERKYSSREKNRKPIPIATHLARPTFKWGIAI